MVEFFYFHVVKPVMLLLPLLLILCVREKLEQEDSELSTTDVPNGMLCFEDTRGLNDDENCGEYSL